MSVQVLVPFDESPAAEHALKWAAQYVAQTRGALHVLTVVPIPPPVAGPIPLAVDYPNDEDLAAARTRTEQLLAERGIHAAVQAIIAQNVATTIVRTADDLGASMVVMGTHGRRGIARALLGSVAEQVVRRASCPVLTVHAPAQPTAMETPAASVAVKS